MKRADLLRFRADYKTTGNVVFRQIEENCLLEPGIHDPYLVCRSNDENVIIVGIFNRWRVT
jgi:hypothetical protein